MALFQELWTAGITIVLVTHEPDIAGYAVAVIVHEGRARRDPTGGSSRRTRARRWRAAVAQREQEQHAEASARMTGLQTLRIAGRRCCATSCARS